MTVFWIIAGLLIAGALLFVLPPLLQREERAHSGAGAAPLTLAVHRDQQRELEADRDSGALSAEQYAHAYAELERRLLEDMNNGAAVAVVVRDARRASALAVLLAAPLLTVSLYFIIGEPSAIAPNTAAPAAGATHAVTAEQIRVMVENLAVRLRQKPEDGAGWAMLARSYNALGRFQDASIAYGKAVERIPDNAQLLADYADSLAMAHGRKLQGEPEALIRRALSIDPDHLKALALAGSAAFEKRDYAGALMHWEKIIRLVPPDSDLARSVGDSIKEARSLAGVPAAATTTGAAVAAGIKPAAVGAAGGVSGVVRLAPALAAKIAPEDTVFIFARAAEGPRMPLAILRKQARELPITFTLDDSLAMSPATRLSGVSQVVVGARVSRTANATSQTGDLQGLSVPVNNADRNITVVIDAEVR